MAWTSSCVSSYKCTHADSTAPHTHNQIYKRHTKKIKAILKQTNLPMTCRHMEVEFVRITPGPDATLTSQRYVPESTCCTPFNTSFFRWFSNVASAPVISCPSGWNQVILSEVRGGREEAYTVISAVSPSVAVISASRGSMAGLAACYSRQARRWF